jgi:hypothetical protein
VKAPVRGRDRVLGTHRLTKWLDLLIARAYRPTTLCTPGLCKATRFAGFAAATQQAEPVPDLGPGTEPDPVPSPRSRDDG